MKVGTDAVLLGAWCNIENHPKNILDIGAGTGVISLMLAQRCENADIDAVEIDEDAFEECVDNFENSPWSDRLFCYHADIEELIDEPDVLYDLIVSNPPFYVDNNEVLNNARAIARSQNSLPFDLLAKAIDVLMTNKGNFCTIIPSSIEHDFLKIFENNNLFPNEILRVKGKVNGEVIRSLINFTRIKSNPKIQMLEIEISRHQYTKDYTDLVKDFYLKM